jgi:large subunit ribosomal protein L11
MAEVLEVLVDGGKATAGPPLGPALGPMGMNIMEIVKAINERTKSFEGMKVPVKLVIDTKTKSYTIEIGTPPTSALILKELGAEKGGGDAGKTRIGNLSISQAVKIANMKGDVMLAKDMKGRVLEVVGTCLSMGVTVDGKGPKEITAEIRAGKYDKALAKA